MNKPTNNANVTVRHAGVQEPALCPRCGMPTEMVGPNDTPGDKSELMCSSCDWQSSDGA